jgi:type I restriction enzyme S subunit
MNAERLLALYDRISEAPDAIARLRRFVLDLAVRGKLVEQDPADAPAAELLKRIAAEKARLAKAGKIRKKSANNPEMVKPPSDLPPTWVWASLGTIFLYDAGAKRDPKSLDPSLWLLELEDVEKDTGRLISRMRSSERASRSTKSAFQPGDILYGKLRPYLNKVLVADEPGYSTTEIVAIRPYVPLCSEYCALALRSPDFVDYVTRLGQGTKMPRLRTEDAVVAPFALPPVAEQHRIVAKVDELMALCDRLEEERTRRETLRDRLTAASLRRLTAPEADSEAFKAHARFALDNLPTLTARPDQIKSLRQAILNLAVRGKLVEQDPTDAPASELLKQIVAEKARLLCVRNGKAKRPIPKGSDKDLHKLPFSWLWVQLDEIAWKITDGDHLTPKRETSGHHLLSARNVLNGKIDLSNVDFVGDAEFERMRRRCDPDKFDVLISCSGSVGRVAIVDRDHAYVMVRSAALVKPVLASDLSPFLAIALISDFLQGQMGLRSRVAAQPNLFIGSIRQLMIPLPPLAEQQRIVAKVDELMALCDELEASLTATDTTRRRLLEALLHEALAPTTGTREAAE